MRKIADAKSILMDSDNPETPRRWFIREKDALVHFVTNLEQVLMRQSGGGPDFGMV
jgi:hypothetical protein